MIPCSYEIHTSKCDTYSMDRPHFHDDIEIMLCISGEGVFFIGSDVYQLARGQLFLIGSSVLHRSVADDVYRGRVFHITSGMLSELSTAQSDFAARSACSSLHTVLTEEETSRLEEMFETLSRDSESGFGGDLQQTIAVMELLLFCFRRFEAQEEQKTAARSELEPIVPILTYIQGHLSEPISTREIADQFFMDKYYLCHQFRKCTGFSLMEYLIKCRVLQARALLRQGKRVQEVGETVGFRSNEYFIRTFKKITGTSPKQYAKLYSETDQKHHYDLMVFEGKDGRTARLEKIVR